MAAIVLWAFFLAACLVIWRIDERMKRHYFEEGRKWAAFQEEIEQEQARMAWRWAVADLQAIAAGERPQGCPRGALGLTQAEYRRLMEERAPVPLELPRWITKPQKVRS